MPFKSISLALALSAAFVPSIVSALTCNQKSSFDAIESVLESGADFTFIAGYATDVTYTGPSIVDQLDETKERPPSQTLVTVFGGEYTSDGDFVWGRYVYDLNVKCYLNYGECGSEPEIGSPRLFMLENKDGVLSGVSDVCGGSDLPIPSPAQSEAIKRCVANGACASVDRALWDE